jgi:hypothetical protein
VTKVTASPASGVKHIGDRVTLTLGFNEAVTVSGKPTLRLNDGSTASYVGGSGTNTLTFRTTVASTDTKTSALAITAVNLPRGASIKDASGLTANLSGAAKTFAGLGIDPSPLSSAGDGTNGTTKPPATTPPVTAPPVTSPSTAPVLSVADAMLSVGRRNSVDLGLSVKSSDPDDVVTVNIKGLSKYDTITTNLNGRTLSGNNVTLTAAEVESGLTLYSNQRWGQSVTTLAATATAKDPTTGAVTTSATKTITVTDPPALSAGTSQALANRCFALLNQSLAGGGSLGRVDNGQIAATASKASTWLNEAVLTRPRQ